MKKYLLLIVFAVLAYYNSFSQVHVAHIGTETQWYPAGYQLMATSEFGLSEHDALLLKFGYNLADRKDFSPYNDHEAGGGFGGTLGYRHFFGKNILSGFYIGGRVDLWGLAIDWSDASEIPNTGTTNITVLQPTGEIGYLYHFKNTPFAAGLNYAAGWEINIVTKGEAVGEGAIGLVGLILNYRMMK